MSRIARIKQALRPEHVETLVASWLPRGRWVGNWYMVCSPFRQERTPSFGINRDGGFYDFGTADRGDLIDLTCRLHGATIQEAIEAFEQMLGLSDE